MPEFMNDKDKSSYEFMRNLIRNYKVFIDTCSILSIHADKFWDNIIPILKEEHKDIIVPYRVYQEVNKFASDPDLCARKSPNEPELYNLAQKAKINLFKLYNEGLVRVLGDKNDNFADNVFQTVFTQYRMKYNMFLITQDKNLADDILRISQSKAVTVNNLIGVRRINKYGFLSIHDSEKPDDKKKYNNSIVSSLSNDNNDSNIPEEEMFAYVDKIVSVQGENPITLIPKEGDILYAQRGEARQEIKLVKAGKSGGEGTIFDTDIPNVVAKIYKPGKVDRLKYQKLQIMITKDINCEGVCFPLALLYNRLGEFVGFLMEKAKGKELQRCVFMPKLLKQTFPLWKKKDTVQLCITILHKLKYLHDRNIILGDINPLNILVVSPSEVYFVDTDSYQVEGYPCPVGTINYTAPEIQKKRFDTFLRTRGNERFAVATLLFMIMLPGKPPYSIQGGENQIDNIINGDFAYASGERSNRKAPEGVWRYMWSHLPRYLKDDFYETFHKNGTHNAENKRFSDADWINKFEHYLELLNDETGKFLSNDSMSADLFPTRHKKDINANYIQCRLCGREVDEDRAEQGYCPECLKDGERYYCKRCGAEMLYSNYDKLIKHSPRYEECRACYDHLNSVYKSITCSDCGKLFSITFKDKEYYEKRGYELPKRCPNCREAKKSYGYSQNSRSSSGYYNNDRPTYTQPTKKKGFCFITTAVCENSGKPDDCYELTLLRQFRDNWLFEQRDGEELIKEYYATAPDIVLEIDKSPDRDREYKRILKEYIEPCIKLIELSAYDTCKKLYMQMVYELKNKFIK